MGRTNLDIDDDAVERIMRRFGAATKTDAVNLALRSLAGRTLSVEEALAMQGAHAIGEVPLDAGP